MCRPDFARLPLNGLDHYDVQGLSLWFEYADHRLAVGEIGVAAAIASRLRRTDPGDFDCRGQLAGGSQVADQEIALGIDVGADMMGDGACVVTEPTPRSKLAAPSHSGRPSSANTSVRQKRT